MLPSIFISHGSPSLMIENNKTTRFLKSVPSMFDRPKYILVISAHWVTRNLEILTKSESSVIYDFYNFPKELYEQEYPANSDLKKEEEIIELLQNNSISIQKNSNRVGYDHGVWSPLSFLYPNADIPVIQLSLPISYSTEELMNLGKVLYPLREDTLILSSGSITHNLGLLDFANENADVHNYAKVFHDWLVEKLENGKKEDIVEYQTKAPCLHQNHPSIEHFLPLLVSYGASKDNIGKSLHDEYMYGNLSMDTIIFNN
jgi:4,5-DOPA dioxygenase extradiol